MGRKKKYFTEEEKKEAKKRGFEKWKSKYPERLKEMSRKSSLRWYLKNKEKKDNYSKEYYKKTKKALDK